jgi:hypothetical protein
MQRDWVPFYIVVSFSIDIGITFLLFHKNISRSGPNLTAAVGNTGEREVKKDKIEEATKCKAAKENPKNI